MQFNVLGLKKSFLPRFGTGAYSEIYPEGGLHFFSFQGGGWGGAQHLKESEKPPLKTINFTGLEGGGRVAKSQ